MRPVDIPSRRADVSSRPTARTAMPVRDRYSQRSASTTRTITPMKATGMKPMLVVSASMTSLLIGPSGWSRSRSAAPWRMLKVPSVAMIDGRRRTRIRVALKIPVARPTPRIASEPRKSANVVSSGLSVNEAVTTHIVTSAATEMSKPPTSSAFVWPIATSARGIVASRRLLMLYSVRNASWRTAVYAPTARIRTASSTSGIQPRNLKCRPPWCHRRSPPRSGARRARLR